MHLAAGFDSNVYLEIAIEEVKEECNLTDEQISCIHMDPQEKPPTFFDSIHYSDGRSIMDGMSAWAVVGGVLGIVYGSRLYLGPLIIGLLGFAIGALIGFVVESALGKYKGKGNKIRHIEFLLLIRCSTVPEVKSVATILRRYNVISLGVYDPRKVETLGEHPDSNRASPVQDTYPPTRQNEH